VRPQHQQTPREQERSLATVHPSGMSASATAGASLIHRNRFAALGVSGSSVLASPLAGFSSSSLACMLCLWMQRPPLPASPPRPRGALLMLNDKTGTPRSSRCCAPRSHSIFSINGYACVIVDFLAESATRPSQAAPYPARCTHSCRPATPAPSPAPARPGPAPFISKLPDVLTHCYALLRRDLDRADRALQAFDANKVRVPAGSVVRGAVACSGPCAWLAAPLPRRPFRCRCSRV
jgi:hypothetical protein